LAVEAEDEGGPVEGGEPDGVAVAEGFDEAELLESEGGIGGGLGDLAAKVVGEVLPGLGGVLHLRGELFGEAADAAEGGVEVFVGLEAEAEAFVGEAVEALGGEEEEGLEAAEESGGAGAISFGGGADGLDLVEEACFALSVGAEEGLGVLDEGFGQAEALGDDEGIAAARGADEEAEGGEEGLGVELDGGVFDAGGGEGVAFEPAEVGGGEDVGAEFAEAVKDGGGKGDAFDGVGAGAEFVEEDEGAAVGAGEDLDEATDVGGEGGEALFEALFVADVGEDLSIHGEGRFGGGGDVKAGLGHQDEEADGFEGDGFAAGVGAGDKQEVEVVAETEVEGDDVGEGVVRLDVFAAGGEVQEEGMAGLEEGEVDVGAEGEGMEAVGEAEACLGVGEVDLGEGAEGAEDVGAAVEDEAGEEPEDAPGFLAFLGEGVFELIGEFGEFDGFDVERLGGVGAVEDDAAKAVAVVGFEGDDGAAVAGEEAFVLDGVVHFGARDDGLALLLDFGAEEGDGEADFLEAGRGVVAEGAVRLEAAVDFVDDGQEVVEVSGPVAEAVVRSFGEFGAEVLEAAGGVEGLADFEELVGFEDGGSGAEVFEERGDVAEAGEGESRALFEESFELGGFGEASEDPFGVGRGVEGEGGGAAEAAGNEGGEEFANGRKLEDLEGVFVDAFGHGRHCKGRRGRRRGVAGLRIGGWGWGIWGGEEGSNMARQDSRGGGGRARAKAGGEPGGEGGKGGELSKREGSSAEGGQ